MIPFGGAAGGVTFRLLGIPTTLDAWFVIGLLFIGMSAGDGRVGIIAAISVGVFVVIHELGHALVARRFGCTVAIRLSMLMGWASYARDQPLSWRRRITISLAGPVTELVIGLALAKVFAELTLRGLRSGDFSRANLWFDVWQGVVWGGVTIALLNLLPLWPLDGGHVVHELFGRKNPGRNDTLPRLTLAVIAACAITAVLVNNGVTSGEWRDRLEANYGLRASNLTDGPITLLLNQIAVMPVRLTDTFFLIFVGLFCGLSSWQVVKHHR